MDDIQTPPEAPSVAQAAPEQSPIPAPQATPSEVTPAPPEAPQEAPKPTSSAVNIYDLSGAKPTLGTIDPEEVTEAVKSGKFSLPQGKPIDVISPDGTRGSLDPSEAHDAFHNGYRFATPKDYEAENYSSTGQTVKAGLEAAARGVAGPLAPAIERAAGVTPNDILKRREYLEANHPVVAATSEIGGLGASMLTGVGEAQLLDAAGEGAVHLAGLGADGAMARIGSAAIKGAVENGIYSSGDSAARVISGDPNVTIQNAVVNTGLATLVGAGVGGGLGSAGELWNATKGSKLGTLLKGISDRAGGIEGATPSVTEQTFQKAGIELSPTVAGLASDSPVLREKASTLSQSHGFVAGMSEKELGRAYDQAADSVASSFGRKADDIEDFDKYGTGNKYTAAADKDFSPQLEGPVKTYEKFQDTNSNVDLSRSVDAKSEDLTKAANKVQAAMAKTSKALDAAMESGDSGRAVDLASQMEAHDLELRKINALSKAPGAIDYTAERLAKLAQDETWTQTPDSSTMAAYKRVTKNLDSLETLGGLRKQYQGLGNDARVAFRAGDNDLGIALKKMQSILEDTHEKELVRAVGRKEGGQALDELAEANKGYAKAAAMKNALNDSLHADSSSVSGFGKALKEMGRTDGEAVFNRLNGKNDANILDVMQKQYPNLAKEVRDSHINQLFSAAAKDGKIQAPAFFKAFNKLSPQLKEFILQGADKEKLAALEQAVSAMADKTKNHSMSGVVGSRLMSSVMGNAMGMATALLSHLPGVGYAVGKAAELASREAGNAADYAMLKFIASNKPISAPGFKATLDLYHNAIKGDQLATKAAKAIFNAGTKVMPDHLVPTDNDRSRLDKQLKKVQADPSVLEGVGKDLNHYSAEHVTPAATSAARTSTYLNSIRPNSAQNSPLDSKLPISADAKAAFNNALDIAHNPLVLMDKIKKGTLNQLDMQHAQAMYPEWVQAQQAKVSHALMDHISKGDVVPYKTRLMVSLFTGQALDSTMTPVGISSAQPTPTPPMQQQTASGSMKNKKGSSALTRAPGQYKTASQSAESDRSDRS